MTTTERLANLNNFVSKRDEKARSEEENEKRVKNERIATLNSYAERIGNIIKVAEFCLANGIPLWQKDLWGGAINPANYMADGVHHNVGLFEANKRIIGVGIKDEGDLIVGENGIISLGSERYFYHTFTRFIKDFDDFEKNFYEYVDNLSV